MADIALPSVNTINDVRTAQSTLIAAIATGEIEPDQVKSLTLMLEMKRQSIREDEIAEQAKALSARLFAAARQVDDEA